MTANEYLEHVLHEHEPTPLDDYSVKLDSIEFVLKKWAGEYLSDIILSGSYAKETAIDSSDLDIFVSLNNNFPYTLKEGYYDLYRELKKYYRIRKQDVSIRIEFDTFEIDITPGKKQIISNIHSIYSSKKDSLIETNVQEHINHVEGYDRLKEIKLLKIWSNLNKLDIPSIYLECLVIKILLGKVNAEESEERLEKNFEYLLKELSKNEDENNLLYKTLKDPAKCSNDLSKLLEGDERERIVKKAEKSLEYIKKEYWKEVLY